VRHESERRRRARKCAAARHRTQDPWHTTQWKGNNEHARNSGSLSMAGTRNSSEVKKNSWPVYAFTSVGDGRYAAVPSARRGREQVETRTWRRM
jgi:hypothetical protein